MKMRIAKSILFLSALLVGLAGHSQMTVTSATALEMIEQLEGQGVTILNPVLSAGIPGVSAGTFQVNDPNFDIDEGVLLTSGRIIHAPGPNDQEGRSYVTLEDGDADISLITGNVSKDACVLEFDIIPAGDTIRFDFIFASEEYSEYVCTNFNDAFAFILTGVTDPLEVNGNYGAPNRKNLAVVPGTSSPGSPGDWVSVNTINGGNPNQNQACPAVNPQFYVDNPINPLAQIQFDGWTTGLTAFADSLTPCNTYHLKLVIADGTDRLWDSGVFIERISSNEVALEIETEGGNDVMYEECNNAVVTFCYEDPVSEDTDVNFSLSGTAINGVDYDLIQDATPGALLSVTIPAGQSCAEIDINTIDDGIGEPLETVIVTVFNPNSDCVPIQPILDQQTVFLYDSLEVFIVGDIELCLGESTVLSVDSGGAGLTWGASPSLTFNPDNSSPFVNITPTQTTSVMVSTSIASCVASDEVDVEVSDMDLVLDAVGESCTDACNGTIDLTINNGVFPFNILWSDGVTIGSGAPTDEDQFGLCQGTYWVRVVDGAGCVATDTITLGVGNVVTINPTLLTYNGGYNVSCAGACDGQIDLAASGGSGTYTFTSNVPGGDLNNVCAGTYMITVTDDVTGCADSVSVTMTEPAPKTLQVTDIQPAPCNGGTDGCATVACVGGSGNALTYEWYLAGVLVGTGPTYCGAATTYNVIGTDDNGCTASIDVSLQEPSTGLSGAITSITEPSCFGEDTGEICVTGTGGVPFVNTGFSYQYNWQNGLGTDSCLTGLTAGTYVCNITDAAGCDIDYTVVVGEPSDLQVLILDRNDIQCEGQDCGSALGIGFGGTAPYSYEWLPVNCPEITGFPISAPAAPFCLPCDYILTVTDANGCKADTTITIDIVSPAMTWDFDVTNVLCSGDSTGAIDLTVSGGIPSYTYLWEGGNCDQGPIFTEDLTNVCAGLWCVTVTDQNGCSIDTCLFIEEPPALGALFNMTPTDCFSACTGEIDLLPYGGTPFTTGTPYTYEWQGPAPFDPNAFDMMPVFSFDEDQSLLCKGWYKVTITDSLGCTFERFITVTAPDDMLITNVQTSDYNGWQISCPDACDGWISVDVVGGTPAAGGYECTWFEQGIPFLQSGTALDSIGMLCASEDTLGYEIIKEDANGCIQNTFVIMSEPDEFTINTTSSENVSCSGGSDGVINVDVDGGTPPYQISVEDAGGNQIFDNPTSFTGIESIPNLPEGCYTIFVTDQNGCTGDEEVCIETPNPVVVVMNSVPYGSNFGVSCAGDCNGIVYATVQGGTPYTGNTYDFTWWDTDCGVDAISNEPFVIQELCAGDYFVTVTDSLGCNVCPPGGLELIAPSPLVDTLAQIDSVDCFGNNNGEIILNIEGGVSPYTYDWATIQPPMDSSAASQSGLAPGVYPVLVSDENGCDSLFSYTIGEPDTLVAVAFSPLIGEYNVTCGGDCDGSLSLSVSGGIPPYSVVWTGGGCVGGSSDFTFNGCVCAGVYSYTVTDANNCTVMGSIELIEPEPILVNISELMSIDCYGECNGQLSILSTTGGSGLYVSTVWSNGNTGSLTNGDLCAGTYSVTVTDDMGCTGIGNYVLNQPDSLELDCTVSNVSCFGANDGSIECTPLGGSVPYSCFWTGPNGFIATGTTISNLAPGEYCKTVSDANACVYSECFTIDEPAIITVDIDVLEYAGGFGVSCFGACDGRVDVTIMGGTPPFVINPPVEDLDSLCAGTYPISVTDDNGCVFLDTAVVTEGLMLEVELSTTLYPCGTNISCLGACDGFIQSIVSGGDSSSYTYSWIDVAAMDTFLVSQADDAISLLCAGQYELYVEDDNGCFGSEVITLTEPSMPFEVDVTLFTYPSGDNISCAGACDGSATFTPSGECGVVTYTWTDGQGTADPTMLCAPDLTLVAIDEANCTYTEVFNLTEPAALITAVDTDQPLCYGDNSGQACFEIVGGSPAYTTTWTGPSPLQGADSCATNLPDGTYYYTVSDINGCVDSSIIVIDAPDSLAIELFSPLASNNIPFNISTPGGMDGIIDATVSGGTEPYTCQWSGGNSPDVAGCDDLDSLIAAEYCLIVIDANMCEQSLCIDVTDPELLTLPNGISPNGDLINDGLEIPGIEVYPDNSVQIFNRWGNRVFERKNYSNGDQWRGEGPNGNQLPDGTYFVIVVVKDSFGQQEELNGYLELRR